MTVLLVLPKTLGSQFGGTVLKLLTGPEFWNVVEALKSAKSELEEMSRSEDWFAADSLDLIEVALEILEK